VHSSAGSRFVAVGCGSVEG